MTIPTEPLYIGGKHVFVKFFGMPRNPGDPSMIAGTFTITPDESVLSLDMLKGDTGAQGTPSPIIRPEWGSSINDPGDLPDDLEESDEGRGWYIAGNWHIWTGDGWRVITGSLTGPPGPTPDITITAEQIEAPVEGPYGSVEVLESGTDTSPNFHLKIPGIVGPRGDNSRISESEDVSGVPLDGQVLVWNESDAVFEFGDLTPFAAKMISVPEYSFVAGTYSATRQVIATQEIAGQDNAWYPDVDGHIRWQRSGLFNSAQVEVEVRIENSGTGSPDTAALCGRALYDPSTLDSTTIAHIRPHFSNTADPSRSVNPDSATGRISAGQATTMYVILHRIGGSGNYTFAQDGAHLLIRLQPVS